MLLLLILIGILAWQLKLCLDKDAQADKDKQALQTKVDTLTKQLAAAQSASSGSNSSSTSSTACSTQVVITQSLKDNLAAAIESGNTAALKGYMADEVNVVFAASEKAGKESPDAAITDLQYLSSATAPWNFGLPNATIDSFKAGSYKQYFDGEIYVGKSSDGHVIAYHFDLCGKIDQIFLSASADLLT